jgi:signal transduction histidine kinase
MLKPVLDSVVPASYSDVEDLERRIQERVRLLEQLDERMRFETLLVDLSAAFVKLPAVEVDTQIEYGLRRIVEFLGIDRSSLGEFSEAAGGLRVTHSYVVPGCPPFPRIILEDQFPWYAERIRRGEMLCFSRLPDEAPAEAVPEREYCLRFGFKSNLTIPLQVGGAVLGAIAFGSFRVYRPWPDELVQRLRLVGEIFANALARKRAEEETQRLREQLARVARLTTMGELAAAIAHEINQPLCAIVSNAQATQRFLAAGATDVGEVREILQDIVADSRRASEVIGRIRTLLQKGESQRTPLDLNDAIREVVALMQHQLTRKGIALSLNLAPRLPLVLGDRVQLQQVVLNLMVNAIDALDQVAAGPRELSLLSAPTAGEKVAVSVRDSGPGIPAEQLERVFDSLFTTKPGGIGIGLTISRSIIQAHDGRIWADPKTGGATFHFTLPALREPAP